MDKLMSVAAVLPLTPPKGSLLESCQGQIRFVLVSLPAAGLSAGLVAWYSGHSDWSGPVWSLSSVPVLLALLIQIVRSLSRGDPGLDIVAAFSMTGALIFGEHLAAVIVALMYAGGQYLESFAERRAARNLSALLARVPRTAVIEHDGTLSEVALEQVAGGDRLFIRRGDIVPVDGTVASGVAILDQSALTGESMPVEQTTGARIMSGSTNVGDVFYLHATRRAAESTYAGIVRLVEAAQQAKAPMARLADQFAMVFLGVTMLLAGGAWLWTGDPIRGLAVLVVATPCPLILAVPVAIVSGVSRAASLGVLVKGGRALENLARVRALVIDKTGTLTHGRAQVVEIVTAAELPESEVLRMAASLDQASPHIIAGALVAEALKRGLELATPRDVEETPGEGLQGLVEGRHVVVGGERFVQDHLVLDNPEKRRFVRPGAVTVSVAIDGKLVGTVVLADELREGSQELFKTLRSLGVHRIVMASGDRSDVTAALTSGLPFDAVHAELTPDRKIGVIRSEAPHGPVMMIGDGVNDAPALAAADIGVAMGANGAAASAEAADVVLLVDDLARIVPAIRVARRSRRIALQSVSAGIGLSIAGMLVAALGFMTPVEGALVQEAIDVAVILNALRALRGE